MLQKLAEKFKIAHWFCGCVLRMMLEMQEMCWELILLTFRSVLSGVSWCRQDDRMLNLLPVKECYWIPYTNVALVGFHLLQCQMLESVPVTYNQIVSLLARSVETAAFDVALDAKRKQQGISKCMFVI